MSCYEWERGEVKVPSKEWKRVRDEIVAAHNALQDQMLALAQRVYDRLTALKSAKGSAVLKSASDTLRSDPASAAVMRQLDDAESAFDIVEKLVKRNVETGAHSLLTPKKKDFPHEAPSKVSLLQYGEFSIRVDNKAKTLTWNVPENNHAIEWAHGHPMGKAFFKALHSVKWTRGSGGHASSNNEYQQDTKEEGGGANFVTWRYGPLGEQAGREYLPRRRKPIRMAARPR